MRVDYGTGIEAPVTLTCVTHLVGDPGAFVFGVTSGTLSTASVSAPLPTSGWSLSGQIDAGGQVSIPGTGIQLAGVPFDGTADLGGLSSVHVYGSTSFTSSGLAGSLDPTTGAAQLSGGLYGTVTLTATADILGQTTQIYAGTCAFGSATSPITVTLSTDPPGVAYSQSTGAVTVSAPFIASLSGCNPAVPGVYAFLLDMFTGTGRLTFSGATDPIITAP